MPYPNLAAALSALSGDLLRDFPDPDRIPPRDFVLLGLLGAATDMAGADGPPTEDELHRLRSLVMRTAEFVVLRNLFERCPDPPPGWVPTPEVAKLVHDVLVEAGVTTEPDAQRMLDEAMTVDRASETPRPRPRSVRR
jgi:hypothetical protein